jgi:chaperonin GroES
MNKFKSVIPLLNRVLIRKLVPEAKSAGGIILSEKSLEKEARVGVVVSVGPGSKADNGQVIPVSVKVGEHVLLPEYTGIRLPINEDNEYLIYKDTELLAVLEDIKKV